MPSRSEEGERERGREEGERGRGRERVCVCVCMYLCEGKLKTEREEVLSFLSVFTHIHIHTYTQRVLRAVREKPVLSSSLTFLCTHRHTQQAHAKERRPLSEAPRSSFFSTQNTHTTHT